MADEELKIILASNQTELKSIKTDMKEIKGMLKSMLEDQQKGSIEMVRLEKDIEYAQRDILIARADFEKKIEIEQNVRSKKLQRLWDEVRLNETNDKANKKEIEDSLKDRDKKVWAIFSMAVLIGIPLIQWISGIISN